MDKTDKFVVDPQFDDAYCFAEGLAVVMLVGKWGYIDKAGRFVINPQFDGAFDFSEGLACVTSDRKCGYVDKAGKYVIAPRFSDAGDFSDGLAPVDTGGRWGYIDKKGMFIISPQFDDAHSFTCGLAAVMLGGKWGYIDKSGTYVINPQFDLAYDFSDGLAPVLSGGEWGYIDKSGTYVINPQFDLASNFSDGLAPVLSGGEWGYIDKSGRYVINPQFDFAASFSGGQAPAESGGIWGYVDRAGRYARATSLRGSLLRVRAREGQSQMSLKNNLHVFQLAMEAYACDHFGNYPGRGEQWAEEDGLIYCYFPGGDPVGLSGEPLYGRPPINPYTGRRYQYGHDLFYLPHHLNERGQGQLIRGSDDGCPFAALAAPTGIPGSVVIVGWTDPNYCMEVVQEYAMIVFGSDTKHALHDTPYGAEDDPKSWEYFVLHN